VNERLRVLFGARYRFAIDSTPGHGTRTLIEIPELEDNSAPTPVRATLH
jgi:sensor histidine kinase YesM